MNAWLVGTAVLLAGGFGPATWLASRGEPTQRLVGAEIAGVVATLALMLFSQGVGQASYLIVPLLMALVSFAGTLVYARLLAPHRS